MTGYTHANKHEQIQDGQVAYVNIISVLTW